MLDQFGREISYLRISVTDRCNLRCRYCMPAQGVTWVDHSAILTYEQIVRIVRASAALGIKKIRLTGGEPLVRKGLAGLVEALKAIDGIASVTLTTNGLLLAEISAWTLWTGLNLLISPAGTRCPRPWPGWRPPWPLPVCGSR